MAKAKNRPRSSRETLRTIDLYKNKIILIAMIIVALFVVLASLQQRAFLR